MFTMKKSVTALAVAVSLGMAAPAFADGTTGYIQGNAIQTDGTKISNATITITNSQTGLTRSVASDDNGVFRFPLLPPGIYTISAEKGGYKTTVQENVKVGISGKTNLNVSLASEDMETIEVTKPRFRKTLK